MIEDETDADIFTGNTYCDGRGRIEKLYLTNRVGYTLRVGFIDTDADIDESVCLYVVVAVAVVSTCLGVLDAESSVCFGVLDTETVLVVVLVAVLVVVLVVVLVAVSEAVPVTSACLGVLDTKVCLGVAVEDSVLLIIGLVKVDIAFGDALTVAVVEY